MDYENLTDMERDEAASRGYRFEVGRKDPEGRYWIGFLYIPFNEIDPNLYKNVSNKLAGLKLGWWTVSDEVVEFFSDPLCGIFQDIKRLTTTFHIDEDGSICVVDELDGNAANEIAIRVLTALRAASIAPQFLVGSSFSVGQVTTSGNVHPTLIISGTWIPPEQR